MELLLVAIVSTALITLTDASLMYHSIRGQSTLKLYVIYNVLEICDKLFSSFGADLLQSAGMGVIWLVASAAYMLVHAMILFYQLMTLNVAVNSHNNALFTLLVSN